MAEKLRELGKVVKIHPSMMVETDKGFKAPITAEYGQELVQNLRTREITVKSSDEESISEKDYNTLNQYELESKFTVKELKQICKQLEFENYSGLDKMELCEKISDNFENLVVNGGNE